MKLPNGMSTERKIIGVDWNRTQVDVFDGKNYFKYADLLELAPRFKGCMLVLEATAESYQLQKRQAVLAAFSENDIAAYCFKTQRTAWFRKKHKIKKKTDAKDAKVIYRIATESPISLHRFGSLCESDVIREKIKDFLVEDRYLYNGEKTRELAVKYVPVIPSDKREFFLSGKAFRKQVGRVLLVAVEVRRQGRGFREFRRQLGNYGNGYHSMPRSEFYHWWTRMITNARLGRHVAKALNSLTPKQRLVHRQVLREADKVAKFLWKITEIC